MWLCVYIYQDIIDRHHNKDLDDWQNQRYRENFLWTKKRFSCSFDPVLIQSHLVSISVDQIEVHDDGKLEKAGDIEDGEVELTCDFHDLHQEEDGPEVDVTQDGPDQEADAEDEAW